MVGESNLDVLIRSMEPELKDDAYVFCVLAPGKELPPGVAPLCAFIEKEGLTLIVLKSAAEEAGIDYQFPCRWITLSVHSSLEAVGFLAAVTQVLAKAGISVNPVSAFYHDHLFIPEDRAEEALKLLKEMTGVAPGPSV